MRVLIVDDEMIVRVGMKSIIDWHSYGFELVGEASNGQEALEKIEELYPDIVITDIKMPILDGLILIEKAKKLPIIPVFIVLSNYNEFEIVKEAMKLGAEDYILKYKMNGDELLKILYNARDKVKENIKNKKEGKQLENTMQKTTPAMERRLFSDIINDDSITEDEFGRTKSFLKVRFDLSSICCMAVKIKDFHELEKLDENDLAMINTSIINITEEIINDNFEGYCIDTKFSEFCIVLSVKKEINENTLKEKLMETQNRLNEMLYKYLNIRFLIGIGTVEHGVKGLRSSYKHAGDLIKAESGHSSDSYHMLVLKAKEYVEKNYKRELTAQEVGDYVNLSRSYFSMLFSEYMNISCNDYITKVRIEEAKNLLKNADYKVYEISEMIGYNDCHYFIRVFKKVTGVTPLVYRTKVQ